MVPGTSFVFQTHLTIRSISGRMYRIVAGRRAASTRIMTPRNGYATGVKAKSVAVDAQSTKEQIDPLKEYTIFGNVRAEKKSVWHYTDRKAGTGYSHYSSSIYQHRPYIWPPLRKLYNFNYFLSAVLLVFCCINFEWFEDKFRDFSKPFSPEASQLPNDTNDESSSDAESEDEQKKERPKKKKLGFRERRIIQYEDRLRMYSTPDKIFRYFATLKVMDKEGSGKYEPFMTPEDFLRSLTPGVMQPRRWGLDSFKVYDPEKHRHQFSDPTSIFYKLGENGLISFADYLFLMTLLSTSPNDFALAFRIFDVNGDGTLDKDEFQKVQQLIMSQTTVGQRHRDHITPISSFRVESNSALETYFFGEDGKKALSADFFLDFQHALYDDVLKMEFNRRDALDGVDGLISEESFAQLLLLHAQIPEKRQKTMLKRVKKKFKNGQGITLDETKNFFQFLYRIEEIDQALHFHRMAGQAVGALLLQRVSSKVAEVELTDHLVDVVITLFDDNLDGRLSNDEMIAVMKRRMSRGLEIPRDTGLFRLFDAIAVCAKRVIQNSHLPSF